jgi:MFS transporter, putative metabolite:H+ symporter
MSSAPEQEKQPAPDSLAPPESRSANQRAATLAILVAALGYFVDIYDLILFAVIGRKSVAELGVPPDQVEAVFAHLLDVQMLGMLAGGILWGVLGDKRGRLSVLFGSIVMYSAANIANGMLTSIDWYAEMRFIAGVGLAGELGAGITLVSEIMGKTARGWGTTLVAGVGVTGAVAAGLIDRVVHWSTAYYIGGIMGFALLLLRIGVRESSMFQSVKSSDVVRGNFFQLFTNANRALRYVALILSGVPVWYLIGILVNRAPKIAADMGLKDPLVPGTAVMLAYGGLAVGDLASGVVSQLIKSRRKAVALFLTLSALGTIAYFALVGHSSTMVYVACFAIGIGGGYWCVFVTMASEQFGTNLRATVTTTAPNFVRGSLALVSMGFASLEPQIGPWKAAAVLGVICIGLALLSLIPLHETFGKSLDFVEK